jgi:hypothetical protein
MCTFECNVALHVDTTTSADGTYKIFQEFAEDVSEDQMNVTKGRYPTGQGIIPFEARWSPQEWTRVLEPV